MKLHRTLAVTLALASFSLNAHSAGPASNGASLNQLLAEAPAAPQAALIPAQPAPVTISSREVTGVYQNFFQSADAQFDAAAADRLRAYTVLLVPGFLSDVNPSQFHLSFLSPVSDGYFEDQMKWLKELGVEHQRLVLQSESSVQTNAAVISAAIKASDKPVLIIGHSKGGLDTLEALRADKTLLAKVRGVITLQSPFYGSPVAEYVNSHSILSDQAIKLLLKMGGTKESMVNLSETDRKKYMADNAAGIAEITAAIPVISVATFKNPVHHQWDTNLKFFRDAMLDHGIVNDGLVPVDSAALPGADLVKLEGLDHSVTVRVSKNIPLDRTKFTKALLLTLFSK